VGLEKGLERRLCVWIDFFGQREKWRVFVLGSKREQLEAPIGILAACRLRKGKEVVYFLC
jgi:hypothetical protein